MHKFERGSEAVYVDLTKASAILPHDDDTWSTVVLEGKSIGLPIDIHELHALVEEAKKPKYPWSDASYVPTGPLFHSGWQPRPADDWSKNPHNWGHNWQGYAASFQWPHREDQIPPELAPGYIDLATPPDESHSSLS